MHKHRNIGTLNNANQLITYELSIFLHTSENYIKALTVCVEFKTEYRVDKNSSNHYISLFGRHVDINYADSV